MTTKPMEPKSWLKRFAEALLKSLGGVAF